MPDYSNNPIARTLRGWISHVSPSSSQGTPQGNQAGRRVQTTEAQRTEGLSSETGNHRQHPSRSLKDRLANSFLGKWFIRQPSAQHLEQRLQTRTSEASNPYIDQPAPTNPYSEIEDNPTLHFENPYVSSDTVESGSDSLHYLEPTPDDRYLEPTPSSEPETELTSPNLSSEHEVHDDQPTPVRLSTLKEQIEHEIGVKTTHHFKGAGKFGSVAMAIPDSEDTVRPIHALKTTINERKSSELEILQQLKAQPHDNIAAVKSTFRSQEQVKTVQQQGYAEGIELEFVGQSLEDVLRPERKLGIFSHDELHNRETIKAERGIEDKGVAPLGGGLPPVLLKKVGLGVASALNHLHTAAVPPILHMDLNPGNILLTGDGTVKLTDFGNSVQLDGTNLANRSLQLHRDYTAPEVTLSELPAPQSEMWSFGSLLYEAATGEKLCLFNPMSRDVPIEDRYEVMKSFAELALGHEKLQKPESAQLKDLLSKLLVMKPEDRLTAEQVLNHPYLQET